MWLLDEKDIKSSMWLYRELEQARFIDLYGERFHPYLLNDFLLVIDTIFDIRAPPLLMILGEYHKFEQSSQGIAKEVY